MGVQYAPLLDDDLVPSNSGAGSGSVTSVSVVSANGLAGSVANATTTPAITLSTTVTGVLKGNGTAISAAVADTDYQAPITLTTIGSSGAATFISNTLNIPQYSGGSSAFNALTSGTNTTAAMVVGTGGSLTASGSGVIAATTTATNANSTGDVTSVGNATTIASNAVTTSKINNAAVTYAKIQNETASTLLGNPTGSGAAPSEITLGTNLSFSGSVLNASGGGSKNVVYASSLGCALNTNLQTGGGTDDTALLQAALTAMSTAGGGILYIDGPALFTQLKIGSNTTIDLCGFGLFSNAVSVTGSLITNNTIVAGPTAATNKNITLRNGYINGNRTGGHGGSNDHFDAAGNYLPTLGFFGVNFLTLQNLRIYESPSFNCWFSNVQNLTTDNLNFTVAAPTTSNNQDGFHFNGYCSYVECKNTSGNINDDFYALNADDGFFFSGGLNQPGSVAGPITDVCLDVSGLTQGISQLRLLSYAQRIDRIRIRGMSGVTQGFVLHISRGYEGGVGNVGTVTISDCQTQIAYLGTSFLGSNGVIITTNTENVNFEGFNINNWTYTGSVTNPVVVSLDSGLTTDVYVNQINFDSLNIRNTTVNNWGEIIQIAANCTVQNLNVNGVNWYEGINPATDALVDGAGKLINLNVNGFNGPPRVIGTTLVPYNVSGDAFTVPPRIDTCPAGAAASAGITITGVGFATTGSVVLNGVPAVFTVNADNNLSVTVPGSATSGLMVITNAYGSISWPFVVTGFVDTFNRSNRSLNGDNGWATQQGTNTYNIVSDLLECDVGSVTENVITNSGVSTASGWVIAKFIYGAATSGMQYIAQCSGGSTWNGYLVDVTNNGSPPGPGVGGLTFAAYHVTGGATFTQIGSTVTVPGGLAILNTVNTIAMKFNGSGVLTMYLNGRLITTFTDGGTPITSAGTCGLRIGGTNITAATRYLTAFACGA